MNNIIVKESEKMSKKDKRRLLIAVLLIVVTAFNVLLAKNCKEFFFSFYPYLSAGIIHILSTISSSISYSIWEVVAGIIVLYLLCLLVYSVFNKSLFDFVSKTILILTILATSFVNIWGLNYFSPTLVERFGYTNNGHLHTELQELTSYLCDKANEYALMIERDDNHKMIINMDDLNSTIKNDSNEFLNEFKYFFNSNQKVKKLLSAPYFYQRGTTGIFICLTGESSISYGGVYNCAIPFTMYHEVAHRNTIAREDEANFISFLTCINSNDIRFIYSAYYEAFIYCANALLKVDPALYTPIRNKINAYFQFDMVDEYYFYNERVDEEKEQSNNEFYSSYLEMFEVENGVESYNDFVDLLLCWYYQNK